MTYRDVGVERLPEQTQILLSDVQHVHLRAGHHDADQSPVFGARALQETDHHHHHHQEDGHVYNVQKTQMTHKQPLLTC